MKRKIELAIAFSLSAAFISLMALSCYQYQHIIDLQKNRKQFTLSHDYIAMKKGVESGEQFPVVGSDWFRCVRVDTR